MSEVTLHGYPVKVGDRVWSITDGELIVIGINHSANYPILTNDHGSYTESGEIHVGELSRIFWQPIAPAAIEAAKVKPKPVEYEWQWLYKSESGIWETTTFYKLESEMFKNRSRSRGTCFTRIEESKREVKS